MSDRPDEAGEHPETKRKESDNPTPASRAREARERAQIRPSETGGRGPEGAEAKARERDHSQIADMLRKNAEFQRRTQGEAVPTRLDEVAEAHRVTRSAEMNRANMEEIRRIPAKFKQDWERAGAAGRREGAEDTHEWVSRGVIPVELSRIDSAEYAGTWESQKSHKYPRESIDASLRSLPEVRQRLEAGAKPEDLKALHGSANPAERQIARTYDSYYGNDAITVEISADGRSRVINGRHRLDSAARMGMGDLPAHVTEEVRRRPGGAR